MSGEGKFCPLTKKPCGASCAWYLGRFKQCSVAWIGAGVAVMTNATYDHKTPFIERDEP